MTETTALERLARAARIATTYEDVFGVAHQAAPSVLRTLLARCGITIANEADAERALGELGAIERASPLEPVYVVAADGDRSIAIGVDAERDARLAWTIVAEDGTERRGTVDVASLRAVPCETADGGKIERRALSIDATLALGYHTLSIRIARGEFRTTIALVPSGCYAPPSFEERGAWGLAVQLYALRSSRSWGIGDFTDLATLCAAVRDAGGSAVGINPLHAVPLGPGRTPSPYSPLSRRFLSWIYLDVERLPGFAAGDVDRAEVAALRAGDTIDYGRIATLKRTVARAAFARFEAADASDDAVRAFAGFVAAGGSDLVRFALFEALAESLGSDGATGNDWSAWPEAFRDPESAEVAAFARERAADVSFFTYLQWQADEQFGIAARSSHLAIGVYRDLAVGSDACGADTWSLQRVLLRGVTVGAPPDVLNTRGQNWGVAPFAPAALRECAYAPFVALLRANMRHAGALRIDHVMALARLYWIPAGSPASDGAYVTYDLDELLGLIALESVRSRCVVIGEDLGTVPEGFRERLAARGVLSYRLLQFEVDDAGFARPGTYPALALVSTGTHDLPPVAAYWTASDIDVRVRLGLLGPEAERDERAERARKRDAFLDALDDELALGPDVVRRFRDATRPDDAAALAELARAANRYLSLTPARLLMVQIEDVLGEAEQVNVPTTVDEHPNWRRRTTIDVADLARDPRFTALGSALRTERGFAYDRS